MVSLHIPKTSGKIELLKSLASKKRIQKADFKKHRQTVLVQNLSKFRAISAVKRTIHCKSKDHANGLH